MRNQTSFRLTTTLLPTDTSAKTTDVINKVDSCWCKFKPTFTEETVVLTNDDRTVMETTRAYACNWALCFTKRGLSDDVSETEVANRKLTWNPWSLAFVTAWAWDFVDKDDDITWTGNQTYTGTLTSCCSATYCGDATYKGQLTTEKWVQYPSFANTTCLQAYSSPFGGMFATVDDTGELYRYNAFTCCWDMVSTAALWTYTFVCSSTAPAACTADTVVTMRPNSSKIYLWENELVGSAKYVDVLLVWWGGWKSSYGGAWGWWVYLWEKVGIWEKSSFCVSIWAAWSSGSDGCPTSIDTFPVASGWGGAGWYSWWAWGTVWADLNNCDWGTWTCQDYVWWGGWWWARGVWWEWRGCSDWGRVYSWNWGKWLKSDITGVIAYYWWWGAGSNSHSWGTCGTTCCGCGVWAWLQWGAQSWLAIVRYPTDWSYWIHCATWGDCVYTCNWYTIHCFTCDGTFTIVN